MEALEQRSLFSAIPAPFPGFVGPMPEMDDPLTESVPPGAGPSTELFAGTHTTAGTLSYSFRVLYRDDVAVRLSSIDSFDVYVYGPNGYARRAMLVSVDSTTDAPAITARYKVAPPDGAWDGTDNGRYTVWLQPNQVFDTGGTPANSGLAGDFSVLVYGVGNPPGIRTAVDVRDFGAIPDDGLDDSNAIEAAINSLPLGNGAPIGASPAGGILQFPVGVFDITRSIKLPSGVTLRGSGVGTVIHDTSTNRNHSAIWIYSPYTHRYNVGATVEDLSIYTRWGGGIWVDPNMGGDVVDLRLANLRVSAKGTGIDLRDQATVHSDIENVEVYNPGSTAVYIGRYDGEGADVRVRGLRVTGTARSGFVAQQGLVVITCDTLIEGLTIQTAGANVVPLYISSMGGVAQWGTTIYDLDILTPTANLPGGIVAHFTDFNRVDIDYMSGVGVGRKLKLTDAHDVRVAYLVSDGSSNVVSQLNTRDSKSYLRVGNAVNGRLTYPPRQVIPTHTRVPAPTNVINAEDFGVIADDGSDDTAALQAAIDSLPRGTGIPGGSSVVGGIVQLPLGSINTLNAIKLPSNVWLRGHNNGTVIRNMSLPPTRGVIELTSPYSHHSNIGASLDQLGIYSAAAAGVRADSTLTGELKDFRMVAVRMSNWGPSVDLRNARVNYGLFDRITISTPGTMAFWLGKPDNSSIGNVVRAVRTAGLARPGFQTEKAMFVFMGDTKIEGGSVEDIWDQFSMAHIRAFYASGTIRMDGLYMEFPRTEDGIGFMFENCRGTIDRLDHVNPWRRVHLINSSDVRIRHLNISGLTTLLKETISVDASSKLTLDTVYGQWDSGMLDHPRVMIKGFYNRSAGTLVEMSLANGGPTLLADPGMTNVSDTVYSIKDWQIYWADGYSGQLGTYQVETVSGVQRLRINLAEPGYFHIRINLNIPASAVGRNGIARWRADGPTQVYVYTFANLQQYLVRSMNSMTAGRTPVPLKLGDQLWINVGSPTTPAAAGTYYFWKFNMVAT